jgi:hypothetical protein
LALGNPTIASGPFYDAFTANRDGWCTFTISAFDSPNLAGVSLDELLTLADPKLDQCIRPYLVTRRWVREKYAEWGPGHPLWEARVLGQFPTQAEDALISLAWLEAAARRPAVDRGGRLTGGLDVAGPGEDETVLVLAEGEGIVGHHAWADQDPRGAVIAALAPYRQRLDVVNVDAAGIGYFLAKHLQDLGFPVRAVNVGERATDRERYANLKAELYWGLRQRFQAGEVAGLTEERTIGQLAGIRYRHTARGQVEIERKEDARKRGVKSPDRAEAVMLALARVTSTQMLWDHELDAEGLVPGGTAMRHRSTKPSRTWDGAHAGRRIHRPARRVVTFSQICGAAPCETSMWHHRCPGATFGTWCSRNRRNRRRPVIWARCRREGSAHQRGFPSTVRSRPRAPARSVGGPIAVARANADRGGRRGPAQRLHVRARIAAMSCVGAMCAR